MSSSYPTVMTSPEFLSVTKLLAMAMIIGSIICDIKKTQQCHSVVLNLLSVQSGCVTYLRRDELVGGLRGTQENLCHICKNEQRKVNKQQLHQQSQLTVSHPHLSDEVAETSG